MSSGFTQIHLIFTWSEWPGVLDFKALVLNFSLYWKCHIYHVDITVLLHQQGWF